MRFIPKGSMCAACQHKFEDCSHLEFHKMKVITTTTASNGVGLSLVKCTEFKKTQD